MAKHDVVVCCWLSGHQSQLSLTLLQEEKLAKKLDALKAVCPTCRNEEAGNQAIFIKDGRTLVNPSKVYICSNGHITAIGILNPEMLHVRFGPGREDFFNTEGTTEELTKLLDDNEVLCHHVEEDGRSCDCTLRAIDDYELSYPTTTAFRTVTRVGDLWDKQGIEPVRPGHYDKEGYYKENKSERANRQRLKRMRKRNTPAERHPGKRIDRPTPKIYSPRDKGSISQ